MPNHIQSPVHNLVIQYLRVIWKDVSNYLEFSHFPPLEALFCCFFHIQVWHAPVRVHGLFPMILPQISVVVWEGGKFFWIIWFCANEVGSTIKWYQDCLRGEEVTFENAGREIILRGIELNWKFWVLPWWGSWSWMTLCPLYINFFAAPPKKERKKERKERNILIHN